MLPQSLTVDIVFCVLGLVILVSERQTAEVYNENAAC